MTPDSLTQLIHPDFAGHLLTQVLGQGFGTLGATQTALGAVLSVFCNLVLTAVLALSTYATLFGATMTAYEGKAMGGGIHTIGYPLRLAIALMALAPMSMVGAPTGGTNAAEMLGYKAVQMGSWLANQTTQHVLDYIGVHAGAIRPPPQFYQKVSPTALGIAESTAAYYVADIESAYTGAKVQQKTTWTDTPLGGYYAVSWDAHYQERDINLGRVIITCPRGKDGPGCQYRLRATLDMVFDIQTALCPVVARHFGNPTAESCAGAKPIPPTQILAKYMATTEKGVQQAAKMHAPELQEKLDAEIELIKEGGWAVLGGYYWAITRQSHITNELANQYPTYDAPDWGAIVETISGQTSLGAVLGEAQTWARNNVMRMGTYTPPSKEEVQKAARSSSVPEPQGESNGWLDAINRLKDWFNLEDLTDDVIAFGTDTTEPLARLQSMGDTLVTASEAIVVGYVALQAGSAALKALPGANMIAKIGSFASHTPILKAILAPIRIVTGTGKAILSSMSPLIWVGVGVMFAAGISLSLYLPFVPMVLWLMALLGWLILSVEIVVAVVLLFATFAIPLRDPVLTHQRAHYGILVLIDAISRPSLMVIGFFMAMAVEHVLGEMIGVITLPFFTSMQDGRFSGPITFLFMIVMVTGLAVIMTHKGFHLTFRLPDAVQRWLGGTHGIQSGMIESGAGEHKQIVAAAVSRHEKVPHTFATSAGSQFGRGSRAGSGRLPEGSPEASQDKTNAAPSGGNSEGPSATGIAGGAAKGAATGAASGGAHGAAAGAAVGAAKSAASDKSNYSV